MTQITFDDDIIRPRYQERFLEDYAGRLMTDPKIAIVELVANCWDAGARKVEIIWPKEENGYFEICDDGTGMTREEFQDVWSEFNYNRPKNQGTVVKFPDPSLMIKRTAYGRNGKGRHGLFCFSNEYQVETWKNGINSYFLVKRTSGNDPYQIKFIKNEEKIGYGTKISCNIVNPCPHHRLKTVACSDDFVILSGHDG